MRVVKVYDIEWDLDNDDDDDASDNGLPESAYVILPDDEDDIADALSDEFGFCVRTFQYDEVEGETLVFAN